MRTFRLALAFFLSIQLSACGQNVAKTHPKDSFMIDLPHPDITADNLVDQIMARQQHFEEQPFYFIRVNQDYCRYQVLVNGVPVLEQYGTLVWATPTAINYAIPCSGPQTITYRLYPIEDELADFYEGAEAGIDSLIDQTRFNITVIRSQKLKDRDYSFEDEEVVLQHSAPMDSGGEAFVGSGLPYFEHSFTFEAEVPYSFKGWTEGQDLTQYPKDSVEKQVRHYFMAYQKIMELNNNDAISQIQFNDLLRTTTSEYYSIEKINRVWNEMKEQMDTEKRFRSMEGSELVFLSDRLVTLQFPVINPPDSRVRGGGDYIIFIMKIVGCVFWQSIYTSHKVSLLKSCV